MTIHLDNNTIKLEDGAIAMKERTAPTGVTGEGRIYTSSVDNGLHFVDKDNNDVAIEKIIKYGEMYVDDNSTQTTIDTQNQWEEVVTIITAGSLSGFTHSGSALTVSAGSAGLYQINGTISPSSVGTGKTYEFAIRINDGTPLSNTITQRKFANIDVGAISISGIVTVADADVVKLVIRGTDVSTSNITIIHANINLHRL